MTTIEAVKEVPKVDTFSSVGIIGAAGQLGELFTQSFSPRVVEIDPEKRVKVEAVIRNYQNRTFTAYPGVRTYSQIGEMLAQKPEMVILATPNPTKEALEELGSAAKKSFTLVLPQNGVDVVPTVVDVLTGTDKLNGVVRASVFTNLSRDENGILRFNRDKNRIALASVPLVGNFLGMEDKAALDKSVDLFSKYGFDVATIDNYESMEYTKLLANLFGSLMTITGLAPHEHLSDPKIFEIEFRALKERLAVLKAAGIEFADIKWVRQLKVLANLPDAVCNEPNFRDFVAAKFASERNNQPPAAARQIAERKKNVEAIVYYHQAIVQLGKKVGKESPADNTILEILKRHDRNNIDLDLSQMNPSERRNLLLKIYGLETQSVFVDSWPIMTKLCEGVFSINAKRFEVSGRENLENVTRTLSGGKSVLVTPNHISHADHVAVMKALKKSLPEEVIKNHPIYIVSGMMFNNEATSNFFSRAYPHPIIWTIRKGRGEEEKLDSSIINRRSAGVIDKLLAQPSIMIVYLEGGRNKTDQVLLSPAPGASSWLLDSKFGLVLPVALRGTEKMLPPGKVMPKPAEVYLQYGQGIDTEWLREQAASVPRAQRDEYTSNIPLSRIREMLLAA